MRAEVMHPKIADRIARRISVTKRRDGIIKAAELADRIMGEHNKDSLDYQQVMERVVYWRNKPMVTDD